MKKSSSEILLLAILVFLAMYIRSLGVFHGTSVHPDERHIMMVVTDLKWENPNPKSFAYGSFPFYLLKIAGEVKNLIAPLVPKCVTDCTHTNIKFIFNGMGPYDYNFILGRFISVMIGGLTVLATFVLSYKLFRNFWVAFLGAFFLSFNSFHIQLSHFYTVDTLLTLLSTAAFIPLLNIYEQGRLKDYIFAGILIGLALATKISASYLIPILFVAHFCRPERIPYLLQKIKSAVFSSTTFILIAALLIAYIASATKIVTFITPPIYLYLAAFIIITGWLADLLRSFIKSSKIEVCWPEITLLATLVLIVITIFIAMPYAFLDFKTFQKDVLEQVRMVRGEWIPPYTIQYLKTLPYLYPLQQMFNFTIGAPLFLLAWGGLFFCLTGSRDVRKIFLALWALGLFLLIGKYQVKFPRYLLPMYPALFIFAGFALHTIYRELKLRFSNFVAAIPLLFFIGYSFVSSLAMVSIYKNELSYATASRWITRNIPPNASLGQPHWDDKLPITLPDLLPKQYKQIDLPFYEPDNFVNNEKLTNLLSASDYVVFPTQRIPASIPRNPETSLFAGKLLGMMYNGDIGFEAVYVLKPEPKFGPFTFNDDLADESLSVYDHPKVVIFKNQAKLPAAELLKKVNESVKGSELPTLEEIQKFNFNTRPSYHNFLEIAWSILLWIAVTEILTLIVFPLVASALPSFPDLGFGISKTLGTFLFGWLIFSGASLGLWNPTSESIRIIFALILAISIYSLRKTEYFFRFQIRNERSALATAEYLWLGAFAAFLIIRSLSPEIFWGEKPMDSTFLHYLARHDSFPPGEPWAAGNTLRYYYLGSFIYAMIFKLTGIAPAIGFNLGLASVAASLVTALYSACLFLCRNIKFAVLFACLIFFCTNFEVVYLTLFGTRPVGFDLFWASTRLFTSPAFTEYPLWSLLFADLHAHVIALPLTVVALSLLTKLLTYEYESAAERFAHRVLLGISIGMLAGINTWDCITYSLLLGVILIAHMFVELKIFFTFEKFLEVLQGWALIGISSLIAALPMLFSILGNKKVGIGYVFANEYNTLWEHIRMFGIWLIPLFLCFLLQLKRRYRLIDFALPLIVLAACMTPVYLSLSLDIPSHTWKVLPWPILLFYTALAITASLAIFNEALFIPALLTAFSSFMLITTELNFLESRMNTIFKFMQPLWIILGLSALTATYHTIKNSRKLLLRCTVAVPLAACLAVGFAGGAIDTYIMTTFNRLYPDKLLTDRPTLDGQLYLNRYSPEEKGLIDWFNKNVKGTPTILEAWGPSYREFGRITMHTGLPVVLGWDYHVSQRGVSPREIDERKSAVAEIYNTANLQRALNLLKSYKIEYIVVSEIETKNYSPEGLRKFIDNPGYFEVVFNTNKAKIFRVKL